MHNRFQALDFALDRIMLFHYSNYTVGLNKVWMYSAVSFALIPATKPLWGPQKAKVGIIIFLL